MRNRRTIICVITAVLTACMFLTVLPLGAAAEVGTVYYGFGKLTEEQQTIYNSVHEGIRAENPAERIVLPADSRIHPAALERIMYLADHPETFWFDGSWEYTESGGYVMEVYPDYRLNGAAAAAEQIKAARAAFQEDTGRSYSDECTSEYELYVPAGDYVLRISKANHVTREYQVTVN